MDPLSRPDRPAPPCLHRRNLDQDQHGAAARLGRPRQETDHPCAVRALQTMNFLGALRHDGIEAPWVLDGPINAEAFKTYVRAELVKILKTEDIVVLDNLNSHKGKAVRAMVKAIGARLFFLPSYSPDLNPIEQAFAKIKHAMRKAMGRSVESVETAVAQTLDTITAKECANYLANAGYRSS